MTTIKNDDFTIKAVAKKAPAKKAPRVEEEESKKLYSKS